MSKQCAVLLSCDELMFALGLDCVTVEHDELTRQIKRYFCQKTSEIVACGTDVILDFGFWQEEERRAVTELFAKSHTQVEWHYLDVSDKTWLMNISERNKKAQQKAVNAYYINDGLLQKFNGLYEPPDRAEIDVWVNNDRT